MGQLKRVWFLVKPYITKYYIAFLIGGVVWMLLDVYAVKGIDASFVSACSNIALVAFAFIAGREARKAWVKRAKEDGYKIAHDLLNYKFINTVKSPGLSDWIQFTESLHHSHENLKLKNKNGDLIQDESFALLGKLKCCFDILNDSFRNIIFPLSQEIQFDIFRMRNMGVYFSSKKNGEFLEQHFMDFLLLSQKCNALSTLLNGYIAARKNDGFISGAWRYEEDLSCEYHQLDKAFEIFIEIKSISLRLLCNLNNATVSNKSDTPESKRNDIHSYFDM